MSNNYDIFISHSSKDKAQADLLWKALEKAGYNCWIAPDSIKPGEDWPSAIINGVKHSSVLALLFNANSDGSGEVRTELNFAKKHDTKIVSIRLAEVPPSYNLEYYIWDKQWVSADSAPFADLVDYVVGELAKAVPVAPAANSDAPAAPVLEAPTVAAAPASVADEDSIEKAMKFRGVKQNLVFNAVRAGATDIEATDARGRTALHYGAQFSMLDIVKRMIKSGIDVNAKDAKGVTPLHLSVGDADVARFLLLNGADIAAKAKDGSSPLDCAIAEKAVATKQLMTVWSEIKRGDKTANQALKEGFVASARYRARNIIDAIAAGADDLTLADDKGRNALHWAAREAELDLVERLLEMGADPKTLDADGNTPANLARTAGKSGSEDVIQLLNEWDQKS